MRKIRRSGWGWIAGGIFLSLLIMFFAMSTRGETKLHVASPDGRFVAYGIEAPKWVNDWALLIPPLQGQTGCRFEITDMISGRTRQVFAREINYDDIMAMGETPRAYSIFWSPDSTTVVCTVRAQRHEDLKYDEFYTRAFATNRDGFPEVHSADAAWFAERLFHELLSEDAARHAVAEQLIMHSNFFNEGVKHLALWCTQEADTATIKEWRERLKGSAEFGRPTPTAELSENKPTVRRTVLNGTPEQYQYVEVDSAWNGKGLFLSVRTFGVLQDCQKEADLLQNGCSAVRVRLSRGWQATPKEYAFARVNGRDMIVARITEETLAVSKSAKCSVRVSTPKTTGDSVSDAYTDSLAFIPWGDFGVPLEDVRAGRDLSFAMTVITATTSGTAKIDWFLEVEGDAQSARHPKGKIFLMP